ncbi:MAG: hypothetical protein RMJ43_05695 [Chloroherpetonaceae bacterium]|nr:hypothetical protein [Chthonomonadaceae bacterium]MDW8207309.1 hypothetical protein [Chloroherpetonaceae bacterium]
MSQSDRTLNGAPSTTRFFTTLLASGWGFAAAYALFHALLISHDLRLFTASLVPLMAVWATLERKRWGRLALLGMSATALGLFVALLGSVAQVFTRLKPEEQTAERFSVLVLAYFDQRAEIALTLLALALMTGFWMRRPTVVAEFERGKKATLAAGQRAIALCLVAFWGVSLLLAPASRPVEKPKTPRRITTPSRPKPAQPRRPAPTKLAPRS